jgi:hypothetical protein
MGLKEAFDQVVVTLDREGDGPWVSERERIMRCPLCKVDLVERYHNLDCPWLVVIPRVSEALDILSLLLDQFVKHRTATHRVAPYHCWTCRESEAMIDRAREVLRRGPGRS